MMCHVLVCLTISLLVICDLLYVCGIAIIDVMAVMGDEGVGWQPQGMSRGEWDARGGRRGREEEKKKGGR